MTDQIRLEAIVDLAQPGQAIVVLTRLLHDAASVGERSFTTIERTATSAAKGIRETTAATQEAGKAAEEAANRASKADKQRETFAKQRINEILSAEKKADKQRKDLQKEAIDAFQRAFNERRKAQQEQARIEQEAAKKAADAVRKSEEDKQKAQEQSHKNWLRQSREREAAEQRLLREREAAEKRAEQQANKAGREFIQLARTFPGVANQLKALTDKYGTFNLVLDRNAQGLDKAQQEARETVLSNKALESEVDRLRQKYGGLNAEINRATFRRGGFGEGGGLLPFTPFELRNLAQGFDRLGVTGVSAFTNIGSVAGPLGLAVAAITLGVIKAGKAMIELSKIGVRALTDLFKSSVELAAGMESVEASFRSVTDTDTGARSLIQLARQESVRLGRDVEEIFRRALPLVESVEQLARVGELVVGLTTLNPRAGEEGAVRAIESGGRGNFRPLQQTFRIDIEPIRERFEAEGFIGFLESLEEALAARGLAFKNLEETFNRNVGSMQQRWEEFRLEIGRPIVDEAIQQFTTLGEIIDGQRDEYRVIGQAIGEIGANIAEFLGERFAEFIESIDPAVILEFTDEVFRLVDLGRTLLDIIVGPLDANNVFSAATSFAEILYDILRFQVLPEIVKVRTVLGEVAELSSQGLSLGRGVTGALTFDFVKAGEGFTEFGQKLEDNITLEERWERNLENALAALDAHSQRVRDNTRSLEERKAALDQIDQGELDAISRNLARARADEALAEAQAELDEAREKAAEDLADAERELGHDLEDAALDRSRKLLDIEEDLNNKRLDIWRDFRDDLAKQLRQNADKVADAATDLQRKEEDIIRKFRDKQLEDDRKQADKRVDIEEDFRRRLRDIRAKFDFDAEEAIRQNDAVALLRIRRRMEFELEQAREKRTTDIEEERQATEIRDRERDIDLENALRDARIANEQKLEDLKQSLAREQRERRIQRDIELREARIAAEQRRAEVQKEHERTLEDLKIQFDRRVELIRESYAEQEAAVREAEARLQQIIVQAAQATAARVAAAFAQIQSQMGRLAAFGSSVDRNDPSGLLNPLGAGPAPIRRGTPIPLSDAAARILVRGEGGPVRAGQPVIVGDPRAGSNRPNPELFIPATNGVIVPLEDLMFSPPAPVANRLMSGPIDNRINAEITMVDPTRLSPDQERAIENMIVRALSQVRR